MSGNETVPATEQVNRYSVAVDDADGWAVRILDPEGETAFRRACADETEARTFASTVEQHRYWLTEEKFRSYYKIPEPG